LQLQREHNCIALHIFFLTSFHNNTPSSSPPAKSVIFSFQWSSINLRTITFCSFIPLSVQAAYINCSIFPRWFLRCYWFCEYVHSIPLMLLAKTRAVCIIGLCRICNDRLQWSNMYENVSSTFNLSYYSQYQTTFFTLSPAPRCNCPSALTCPYTLNITLIGCFHPSPWLARGDTWTCFYFSIHLLP